MRNCRQGKEEGGDDKEPGRGLVEVGTCWRDMSYSLLG